MLDSDFASLIKPIADPPIPIAKAADPPQLPLPNVLAMLKEQGKTDSKSRAGPKAPKKKDKDHSATGTKTAPPKKRHKSTVTTEKGSAIQPYTQPAGKRKKQQQQSSKQKPKTKPKVPKPATIEKAAQEIPSVKQLATLMGCIQASAPPAPPPVPVVADPPTDPCQADRDLARSGRRVKNVIANEYFTLMGMIDKQKKRKTRMLTRMTDAKTPEEKQQACDGVFVAEGLCRMYKKQLDVIYECFPFAFLEF